MSLHHDAGKVFTPQFLRALNTIQDDQNERRNAAANPKQWFDQHGADLGTAAQVNLQPDNWSFSISGWGITITFGS